MTPLSPPVTYRSGQLLENSVSLMTEKCDRHRKFQSQTKVSLAIFVGQID